jgi:hypothetical protein
MTIVCYLVFTKRSNPQQNCSILTDLSCLSPATVLLSCPAWLYYSSCPVCYIINGPFPACLQPTVLLSCPAWLYYSSCPVCSILTDLSCLSPANRAAILSCLTVLFIMSCLLYIYWPFLPVSSQPCCYPVLPDCIIYHVLSALYLLTFPACLQPTVLLSCPVWLYFCPVLSALY